jgi:H+/Cl- antiporter ClcA
LAALVYVEEHFCVRASRRATLFAVAGALGGFLLAVVVFDVRVVLPAVEASWRDQAVAVCIVALPAALAARVFVEGRTRLATLRVVRVTSARFRVVTAIAGAAIAAAVVARYPLTAGNGMDVLRDVSTATDVAGALVVAMVLAKLVGALATFGSGAPGGALTPTIVVGGGAGLAVAMLAERLGWATPGTWTIVVLGGAAAIAVGLRAPLTAVVLLPELTGSYALVPACAVVVLLAVAFDRSLDAAERRWGGKVPVVVHDEDG